MKTIGVLLFLAFMLAVLLESPICIPQVYPFTYLSFFSLLISFGQLTILANVFFFFFAIWKRTRSGAGAAILVTSYIFGIAVWLFSAVMSFSLWGYFGLFVGLILLGVGVVPMALLAAAVKSHWDIVEYIIVGVLLTYGNRVIGVIMHEESERL